MGNLGAKEEQAMKLLEMVEIAKTHNCKKCCGRGYEGWDEKKHQFIPCDCLTKAADRVRLEKRKQAKEAINLD